MKIKSIFKYLLTIAQIALILFSVSIHYLSNERMGVMRSLVYRNDIYDKLTLKTKIIYILCFMVFMLVIFAIKTFKLKHCLSLMLINVLIIIFVIKFNSQMLLSYYALAISLTLLLVIQFVKSILSYR